MTCAGAAAPGGSWPGRDPQTACSAGSGRLPPAAWTGQAAAGPITVTEPTGRTLALHLLGFGATAHTVAAGAEPHKLRLTGVAGAGDGQHVRPAFSVQASRTCAGVPRAPPRCPAPQPAPPEPLPPRPAPDPAIAKNGTNATPC